MAGEGLTVGEAGQLSDPDLAALLDRLARDLAPSFGAVLVEEAARRLRAPFDERASDARIRYSAR